MLDLEGNLVTNEDKIAEMALSHYIKLLENKQIKKCLKHLKDDKEKPCAKLLELARKNKTPPWEVKHLELVLKRMFC